LSHVELVELPVLVLVSAAFNKAFYDVLVRRSTGQGRSSRSTQFSRPRPVKPVIKAGQSRSKPVKAGQSRSKPVSKAGQSRSKPVKAVQSRSAKPVKYPGQMRSNPVKPGQSRSKSVSKAGQSRSKPVKGSKPVKAGKIW